MTPFAVLGLSLLAVLVTVILALISAPRGRRRHNEPMIEYERSITGNGYHLKQTKNIPDHLVTAEGWDQPRKPRSHGRN